MADFQIDEYHWNTNFLNDTKLNLKAFNDIKQLLEILVSSCLLTSVPS